MKTIVIGFDGSEAARDALSLGGVLARSHGAELVVVTNFDYAPLTITAFDYESVIEDEAEELFRRARGELGDLEAECLVQTAPSAAHALVEVAESREADLIVVGSTHRRGVGLALLGSTAERVIQGAPCAVMVAPDGYEPASGHPGIARVGVGIDGSPESLLALEAASELARSAGATLRVIGIASPPPKPLRDPESYLDFARQERQGDVDRAVEWLDSNVDAEGSLLEGDPAERLLEQGRELDVLVLGSRGYGPLRRTLLGGVSGAVAADASCAVMVVPRPHAADSEAGAPDIRSAHAGTSRSRS